MLDIIPALIAQAEAPSGAGGILGMAPILLMFVVIYFLMIRPQQKQAKKHRDYVAGLKKGDEVVTNSGIFGKIEAIEDTVVRLEIARDIKIRVLKSQIAGAQPGAADVAPGAPAPARKD
ncbi:preprotein translocase subunit YajC [Vulgatibacter incomptus]|uniref:Sec translocon accessory complex subunit YajC n=1 Tax=Vulgatibacter incomptus TaxID=1391653 RepID=A0A0K1P9U3_9BACT|nr:preprotein translocase subunit YajC [Vulgatibacter incomptus]AKU89884.1 Preprotein translocase subunit YajC [Vulgatibacter incomptus]